MHLRNLIVIIILCTLCSYCDGPISKPSNHQTKKIEKEASTGILDSLLQRGKIKAVTDYGSVNYFIYRGEPMGYQYELLVDLANYLKVDLELIIEKDLTKSNEMLMNGEVDLVAMGLTVTNERSRIYAFTDPIMTTRQVLVQKKPKGFRKMRTADEIESHMLRNPLDLAKKTIHVQRGTIFTERLKSLADEIADSIYIIEDDLDVEELIAAVANGEIEYTISDEHIALVGSRYHDNIDIETAISFPQKIAWAAEREQIALVDTINDWLKTFNKSLQSRLLYNKYFKNIRSEKIAKSQYNSFSGGQLSRYDKLIKKASRTLGWDWRLLASLIYQESEFKPNVRSWVGAYGLMQLMPLTLEKYGIDTTDTPKQQINAGIKYLKYLDKQLPAEISDSLERKKFVLASYNAGIGHVFDGRRLAEKYDKDPNIWTNNVDYYILNLSHKDFYHDTVVYYGYTRGQETYDFVEEIMSRYEQYKKLIKD